MSFLLPIQLIFLTFLLFAGSRAFLRLKEGNITLGAFLFWVGLWILATFSVLDPEFTSFMAKKIGIGRGTDVVIYISIALLFYLIFRTNVMMENLKHEITKLTTEIALLKNLKGKKKKYNR